MSLKDAWKETGKGLCKAFTDLGKTIVKSAKAGVEKVDEWANKEDYPEKAANEPKPEAEIVDTTAEESAE
ncbi:MAG: hypothetical protein IJ261_00520 [Clostridia bacterium]|nr:hypothetical protein [Clostridia bacterium]